MIQIAIFNLSAGDTQSVEEMNRFLRGHRVLTIDRQFQDGGWSCLVSYQLGGPDGGETRQRLEKIDYKQVLDPPTFAVFSALRECRKALAEKESLPPYAVFTNEQLAEVARRRCATMADLAKIDGIGPARVEKFGAAIVAVLANYAQQQSPTGTDRGA